MKPLTEKIILLEEEVGKLLKECSKEREKIISDAQSRSQEIISYYKKKIEEEKKQLYSLYEKEISSFQSEKAEEIKIKLSQIQERYSEYKEDLIRKFFNNLLKEICND